jgi:type 1 glutamine amidotransferase
MNSLLALAVVGALAAAPVADDQWLTLAGKDGPGKGKHVVLVSGDEEYRSEEALTQLGKILSARHGFNCTVLYAIDPKDGTINPNVTNNIPGLEALKDADLMVIATRFRNLPDDQLRYVADYLDAGKPVIGMRTATHAFSLAKPKESKFGKFHWQSKEEGWEGGFGRHVLGETWVNHHGAHGKEGTRGIIVKGQEGHPILSGIKDRDIFGTTDVYTVRLPLPGDCKPLVLGEVTETLDPTSKAVAGKKNDPMMPVAWTKTYSTDSGKTGRVFATTMGASQDLVADGTRRMLLNACYWAVGLDDKIPEKSDVAIVGTYEPRPFKNNGFKPGVKPSDLAK